MREAKDNLGMYGKKTILFVDEIHRFNKGQQDYLLPYVEDGTLILIGATTENPFFEVNGALLSRSRIFELKPLEKEDVKELIRRAVCDEKRGMGSYGAEITDEGGGFSGGCRRRGCQAALNAVELGVLTTDRGPDGKIRIDLNVAQECIQKRAVRYDKSGDSHYDTISAFIKSMRGSDPDAALYYLARMLYAGEDIKFIARRIMICAAEDVGMADPQALNVAVSASLAVERIGMPEAENHPGGGCDLCATAPKSNASYRAVSSAESYVSNHQALPVPPHLQDRHYGGAAKLGRGLDYKYAHDYPNHYVKQQYLPDGMEGTVFYRPTEMGYEKQVGEHLDFLRRSAEHLEFIKRTLENRRKNERREAKALGRGSHDCDFSGRSGDGGSAVFKIPSQLWGFLAGGGGVRAGEERISQPHLSGPTPPSSRKISGKPWHCQQSADSAASGETGLVLAEGGL